jgi:hypothetical protein
MAPEQRNNGSNTAHPEISLNELKQSISQKQGKSIIQIATSLIDVMAQNHKKWESPSLTIPGVGALAQFFSCSQGEILNMFLFLRSQGYDYDLDSTAETINIWKKAPTSAAPQRRDRQARPKAS